MTPECRQLEVLRSLHAAGALEGAEAARVAAHLEACAACREAERRDRELLGLVRLPDPSPAEALALADVPARALREIRARDRRRTLVRRLVTGTGIAAVAAAVVVLLLSPALLRGNHLPNMPVAPAAAAEQVAWQEPDAYVAWDQASQLDWDGGSSSSSSSMTDATLAAYDAGVGE